MHFSRFESKYDKTLNNSQVRLNTCFSLRKDKLTKGNFNRRYESYIKDTKCTLQIEPDIINSLPIELVNKFQTDDKKEKLSLLSAFLSSTNSIEYISFAVYSIRNTIESFLTEKEVNECITEEILNCLFNTLSLYKNTNNLQIIYEITQSLKIITKISSFYCAFLADFKQYLNVLIQLFQQEKNIFIMGQLMLIFGNLIQEREFALICQLNMSFSLHKIIAQQFTNSIELIPNNIKWIMIWIIGLIIKYLPENLLESIISDIYPVIEKLTLIIKTDIDKSVFEESIECLRVLTDKKVNDDILHILYKNNFYNTIITHIKIIKSDEILFNIFSIITNLSYDSNSCIIEFCHSNCFDQIELYLNDFLNDEKYKTKKKSFVELCTFIYNCSQCEKGRKMIMRKHSILKLLIRIFPMIEDKKSIKEIVNIIIVILEANGKDRNNNYIEMIRLGIPELLYCFIKERLTGKSNFNNSDNMNICVLCLNGIQKFLEYGNQLIMGVNIIFEHYEKMGFRDVLEKLNVYGEGNSNISLICSNISSKYFRNY